MDKNSEITVRTNKLDIKSKGQKRPKYSRTVEISRKGFIGEIPTKHHAVLEIIGSGGKRKHVELGEGEVVLGRTSECGIQLSVENVSREHALIFFRNEEYHIEDLGSTNGVYVNGIKIEKCVLRNHDRVEIGDVEILFSEEKMRQKT